MNDLLAVFGPTQFIITLIVFAIPVALVIFLVRHFTKKK